jgi:hypothetical protein
MKLSEVIEQVIILAREANASVRTAPEGVGADDLRSIVKPSTEAERRLKEFILSQSVAVVYTLTLVMYAGRGDFPIENFLEQYEEMRDTFDSPMRAAGQMMEKVPLPEYLEDGLRMLREANIDVDTLMDS